MAMTNGERMVWAAAYVHVILDMDRGGSDFVRRADAVSVACSVVREMQRTGKETSDSGRELDATHKTDMLRDMLGMSGGELVIDGNSVPQSWKDARPELWKDEVGTSSEKVDECVWTYTHDARLGVPNYNTCAQIGMHKDGNFCPHCGCRIVVKEKA